MEGIKVDEWSMWKRKERRGKRWKSMDKRAKEKGRDKRWMNGICGRKKGRMEEVEELGKRG